MFIIVNSFLFKCKTDNRQRLDDFSNRPLISVKLLAEGKKTINLSSLFQKTIIDLRINAVIDGIVVLSVTILNDHGKSWYKIAIDWELRKSYLLMRATNYNEIHFLEKGLKVSYGKKTVNIPVTLFFQDILLVSHKLDRLYSIKEDSSDRVKILETKLEQGILSSEKGCQTSDFYFPLVMDYNIAIITKKVYLYDVRKCSSVEFYSISPKLHDVETDTIDQSILIQSLINKYYKSHVTLQKGNMIYTHANVICQNSHCFYIEADLSADDDDIDHWTKWRISKINLKTGKKEYINNNGFQSE